MCTGTPDIPSVPERQAMKLPDNGAPEGSTDNSRRRRAIIAGLMTSPSGTVGSPSVGTPTLG
ncbi:hypothetical protein [Novosphingobium pentaromativorans]|nr:hypothetical protein [Novosphingobium pentaromativorans]AIT81228.1 hypothetical protein JI59_16290 [Novosphingobium pentaromativorans US6-1]BBA74411.1 hypothetical protein [Ochrobactrum sp. PW1]GFM29260.1 uncharacterized protein PY1_contig-07-186 [Novosphingobium sp. PY1]